MAPKKREAPAQRKPSKTEPVEKRPRVGDTKSLFDAIFPLEKPQQQQLVPARVDLFDSLIVPVVSVQGQLVPAKASTRNDFTDRWFDDLIYPENYLCRDSDGFTMCEHDPDGCPHETTAKEDQKSLFSRHLSVFKNGEEVQKVTVPFGHQDALWQERYTVKEKFFDREASVTHIVLQSGDLRYLLDHRFFGGWMNDEDEARCKNYFK